MDIGALRLHNQHISRSALTTPEQVVAWMGGMQGQDFPGAKWSIGLRLPKATDASINCAFDEGRIIRTWPMRGTLHIVAAADVRWILSLTSPGNLAGSKRRRDALELDDKTLGRCREVFARILRGGKQKSREEMYSALESAGISTAGQRGYHILWNAALHGLICFAATTEKEQTFALLDEWVPPAKEMARDEALAELARRYFTSRGPATLQDFIWWSGLSAGGARAGFEAVKPGLVSESVKQKSWWMAPEIALPKPEHTAFALPGFDEYLLGYKDRSAVLDAEQADKVCPGGNGVFASTIVIDGRVAGTWKRTIRKTGIEINTIPFATLGKTERRLFHEAAQRYAAFMGYPLKIA
ncbi:MAG: winged helix DNA-binding domain-containing protein [Sideroxyarcus sp.]|nr:winged helix DNA-binding domain-containing protein [Sideroxyarcus sp.]